jgi:predicted NAD/FAD-binding protein
VDPGAVLRKLDYAHPVFTPEGVEAQRHWREVSGHRHTHYCGAYWRWGFHEDGVWSALRVSEALGGRGALPQQPTVALGSAAESRRPVLAEAA